VSQLLLVGLKFSLDGSLFALELVFEVPVDLPELLLEGGLVALQVGAVLSEHLLDLPVHYRFVLLYWHHEGLELLELLLQLLDHAQVGLLFLLKGDGVLLPHKGNLMLGLLMEAVEVLLVEPLKVLLLLLRNMLEVLELLCQFSVLGPEGFGVLRFKRVQRRQKIFVLTSEVLDETGHVGDPLV
jgi:hypothetical protein